uniref:Uncharacterized protein n=1 Tax=Caenorhabditis japonica TaxID=281687 RepID=A0A8R1EGQ5_CAEJA
MVEFRDYMISTIEDKLESFDNTRQYMNGKTASQGECLFECLYPGRNRCTKQLKCDIYLPPEDIFFDSFNSCAERKKIFKKAEQIYQCISKLMISNTIENVQR